MLINSKRASVDRKGNIRRKNTTGLKLLLIISKRASVGYCTVKKEVKYDEMAISAIKSSSYVNRDFNVYCCSLDVISTQFRALAKSRLS